MATPIPEIDTTASKTKDGYASAKKRWDAFVGKQNTLLAASGANYTPIPTADNLTQDFVCGRVLENGSMESAHNPPISVVFGQFAQLLLEEKKDNGDACAPMVCVQHFCNMKACLFKRFKPLGFRGESPDWCEELHRGLKLRVKAECIKRGAKIVKKATGFSRATLLACLLFIMKQDNEALGCEERAVLTNLFHAVGRATELEASTWESARWDNDREFLAYEWGETKNGTSC